MNSLTIILLAVIAYLVTKKCDVCQNKEKFRQTPDVPTPVTPTPVTPAATGGNRVIAYIALVIGIIFGTIAFFLIVPSLIK